MSGTHHLYTSSGRAIPPPPKTTPHRRSSVCRTPTRRFNPVEKRQSVSPRRPRRDTSDRQLIPVWGGERSADIVRHSGGGGHFLVEDGNHGRGQQAEKARPKGSCCVAPPTGSGNNNDNDNNDRRHLTVVDDSRRSDCGRLYRGSEAAAQSQWTGRSYSPQESEGYNARAITSRLRRSMSRGYSPRHAHSEQAVVGTELVAPMPLLQGAHRTSKNRYRTTIERFIASQPIEAQEEMLGMLEEYKGRECELCEALSEAYSDSWEAAVKGNSFVSPSQVNNNNYNNNHNNRSRTEMDKQKDTMWNKENGRKFTDSLDRSDNRGGENADGMEPRTSKPIVSAHSTPSKQQPIQHSANRQQQLPSVASLYHSDSMNRTKSLEKERYDEDTSPQPRQGGRSAPRGGPGSCLGTFLEYRDLSPRSGGMLTPPIPADLVSR